MDIAGLRPALALGLALSAACAGPATEPQPRGGTVSYRGADVSALERVEQAGGVFRDGGRPGDAIAILRAHGSNILRLRLFVNPNQDEVQVNDLEYTMRMAGRARAAGAALLLDLHYSWWYPEAIQVPGLFIWGGGSLALFDAGGNVLPAASRFALR